jgi:hypothetical protein
LQTAISGLFFPSFCNKEIEITKIQPQIIECEAKSSHFPVFFLFGIAGFPFFDCRAKPEDPWVHLSDDGDKDERDWEHIDRDLVHKYSAACRTCLPFCG